MSTLKRHPLTGQSLQAVYIDRHGRPRYPMMGGSPEGDDAAAQAATEAAAAKAASDKAAADAAAAQSQPGFPANTPVAEMKPAEQAEYWRDRSKKHEGRVKAFGDLRPEDIAALREKADRQDALEDELASDKEKAVKEAKTTTQSEADAKYRPMLAETAFRVAVGDRKTDDEVTDFLADLNLDRFITDDGRVDTAKVLSRVEQFAPAKGNQHQRAPVVTSHGFGNNSSGRSGGGSVAEVMAERAASRAAKSNPLKS